MTSTNANEQNKMLTEKHGENILIWILTKRNPQTAEFDLRKSEPKFGWLWFGFMAYQPD